MGQHIEERSGFLHYIGRDEEAKEIKKALASKRAGEHGVGPVSGIGSGDDFVVVCGGTASVKCYANRQRSAPASICQVKDLRVIRFLCFIDKSN